MAAAAACALPRPVLRLGRALAQRRTRGVSCCAVQRVMLPLLRSKGAGGEGASWAHGYAALL